MKQHDLWAMWYGHDISSATFWTLRSVGSNWQQDILDVGELRAVDMVSVLLFLCDNAVIIADIWCITLLVIRKQ